MCILATVHAASYSAAMQGPFADKVFRLTFAAAGIYNLAFGIWAGVWPQSFFKLFDVPQPNYPQLWSCLGMVVGVYGLLYLYAARRLDAAWPIVAVGLLGKVLGPIGMVLSFSDAWPQRLGTLCLYNDLIWWLPFGCFLIRNRSLARRITSSAAWWCVAAHLLALAMLALVLRHGGPIEPDVAARASYIAAHPGAWTFGWATWMIAAVSLVGFYAWWGGKLAETGRADPAPTPPAIPLAATFICGLGMVCDFSGEGLMLLWMPERIAAQSAFGDVERAFTLLCAGAANGLYTLAGILLTCLTRDLPRWVCAAMWTTWLAGAVMTIAGIADSMLWISISSAILFPLLLVWTLWMALLWRRS